MTIKKKLRNAIIGKNRYIQSFSEYRQVMLSGQFAMIAMGIIVVNCFLEDSLNWLLQVYAIEFLLFGFSIFLHRLGKHEVANYCMLLTSNLALYCFTSSESIGTGIFVYYIVITIGSFAVFSHKNRLHAIFFTSLAVVLFFVSYFVDFKVLPWRDYSPEKTILIATVNFLMAVAASGLAVSLLTSLNHESARQLSESNKLLMKTNAELDRFVYSTSHDLRAPLTSIMGLINIASNEHDSDELKRYLRLMKGRVDSLDVFIKDITDYARNNRNEVGSEWVRLKELALEVWEDLKFSPDASRIFFDVQIEDSAEVISDRQRLRVILGNLISNAVRYHDGHKDTQFIRLHYKCTKSGFDLSVEDNGQGIAEEYHQRIFDMFYRGNESSKGSGLGLYIVKETLDKLSGSIKLHSIPGEGSSFRLSFPNNVEGSQTKNLKK